MSFDDLVQDSMNDIIEDYEELKQKTEEFVDVLKERFNESVDDMTDRFKGALDAACDDIMEYKSENSDLKKILKQHNIDYETVEVA